MTVQDQDADRERELEPSEIHNVLRNDRRRRAIEHLRDVDGTLSVDTLAEHIAAVETGESPPRDVRKSVYVSLHQTHLPKLNELDIIDYDQREQELELRDRAEEVEVYMEIVPEGDISWATYYLGVSVLAILTLFAVNLEFAFVSAFGVEFWTWYFLFLFALSAAYHAYSERKQRVFES
ncbi:hypothetical protein NGM10_04765 [Halorussus salilacus]|uniref:DUF7344 domain-containing protein n=1 Tax=Halorussus salilacus TaxID=2953750 RepID=UPI0020A14940|nr:hypothetical protein [Halorussus salilacus]USZ69050.1 hypothetical protein NGM10_04765 [Halorussus salilacus]